MEHWNAAREAVAGAERVCGSIRLATCIGLRPAKALAIQAEGLRLQLEAVLAGSHDNASAVSTACRLTSHTLQLVDAVDLDHAAGEAGLIAWGFSVELAEAIGFALAGMVCSLTANMTATGRADLSTELEAVGSDLDSIALHLYGGLCRLDDVARLNADEANLVNAFQCICTWSLSLLCCCSGSWTLTSEALWEWASADGLWAFVLVKGVVMSRAIEGRGLDLPLPSNLSSLRQVAVEALLGTASPSIAFSEELQADLFADDLYGGFTIGQRTVGLAQHRARLAVAASDCSLLDSLVREAQESEGVAWLPSFASFLSSLAQPPPEEVVAWEEVCRADEDAGAEVQFTLLDAKGVADAFAAEVSVHSLSIWHLLTTVPRTSPRLGGGVGFLRDCACLAYSSPMGLESCCSFVEGCFESRTQADLEPSSLAALCLLSANCGVAPGERDGGLSAVVALLPPDVKQSVADQMVRSRVPVKESVKSVVLTLWTELLGPALQISAAPSFVHAGRPLLPQELQAITGKKKGQSSGLRDLLHGAPRDLCCELDGRLLVDPVRTPYGNVFERSILATCLQVNGCCPLTGLPLLMEQCQRDADLRIRAARWVRSAKPMQRRD